MAQGLRQFAARPSWRPGARIFTGRGLRDAFGQRPCLTWAVTARGSPCGCGPRRKLDPRLIHPKVGLGIMAFISQGASWSGQPGWCR